MDKTEFLTIFPTFENIEVVRKTLPSVIQETKLHDAKLIVHDSSVNGREEKWKYLIDLNSNDDFFLILSTNLSMAHARNMCLQLCQELYAPDFICILEDDHGYKSGFIPDMISVMKTYYGKISPNGLRFGLFSGCGEHLHAKKYGTLEDDHIYPDVESIPMALGGVNNCCRCAPTAHWNTVIKGYDTDEYLISTYQTKNLNFRNYHKGFTAFILHSGQKMFIEKAVGRGFTSNSTLKLWDEKFTASDPRSVYLGKINQSKVTNTNDQNSSRLFLIWERFLSRVKLIK